MKYNIDTNNIPEHIGIIMDGNGRYAQKLGLKRNEGHKAGAEQLNIISEHAGNLGVKYLTVYTFSTENWKRPKEEVAGIMKLLRMYLLNWEKYIGGKGVRIRVLGDISKFEVSLQKLINFVTDQTKNENKLTLNIALGYGGRNEIVSAAKSIASEYKNGNISLEDIDEKLFSEHLYTKDIPDPDLIIRPGGELRLSNFLTWQSAYSEFWFTDVLWPEFSVDDFDKAIYDYQTRHRRYGGL